MRSPDEGYQLVSTQVHVTSSPSADGGGPGGAGAEATASSTQSLVQLSNAYAFISQDQQLHLFIGGSIIDNDTLIAIALQTNADGVSNLANQGLPGNLGRVAFDPGFKPNAFINVAPAINDGYTGRYDPNITFTDLSKEGHTLPNGQVGHAGNNALLYTAVGSGQTARTIGGYNAPADPGFAEANTGLELTIPLVNLGYDGKAVRAIVFPDVGSSGRTNNQVLAPFASFSDQTYDYTYIDNNRQFTNENDYPGDQWFGVPAATEDSPEPASVLLGGIGGLSVLQRRGNRRRGRSASVPDRAERTTGY